MGIFIFKKKKPPPRSLRRTNDESSKSNDEVYYVNNNDHAGQLRESILALALGRSVLPNLKLRDFVFEKHNINLKLSLWLFFF